MIRIIKKLALAAGLAAVVLGMGTGVVFAQGDTDDSISPPNTSFTATATNVVIKIKVNGITVTVTCKSVTISGTTPASGQGPVNITKLSFTGCTDNAGGTDTVKTNNTNGSWQLTFIDSIATGEETQTEPNTGDSMGVTIPKAGATLTSTVLSGCTVIVAPNGPVTTVGSYDDMNTLSFNNSVSIPAQGVGCSVSSITITATFKFTPGLHDVS